MKPEAVDQMGQQIEQAGQDAMAAFNEIAGRVESFEWTGEDQERFVSEFEGTVQQLATTVQQRCTEFAERAKQNAAMQRETSSS
ncbi:MAG: hypothetical protein ACTMKY_01015 [Dermabacteraceae bacterium]|nr:hypothetical protein [Brachybacterium sp.]MDN6330508.1 hypothetical protein [Brachybacterium sp.]MDN6398945.1 hypothetical protein [Brachybacterium sp.]